jgi:hypothetical protein
MNIIQILPHVIWNAYIAHIDDIFYMFPISKDLFFYEHQKCNNIRVTNVLKSNP